MIVFEHLDTSHDIESFRSGSTYLDHYLKNEALAEQDKDLARSFVAIDSDNSTSEILGYFTLKFSPQYVPSLIDDWLALGELAYLARDEKWRGKGMGTALLLKALYCFVEASQFAGFPGIFLYATEEGTRLYESWGFKRVTPDRRGYFLSTDEARAVIRESWNGDST